jgi:hypothetical protein
MNAFRPGQDRANGHLDDVGDNVPDDFMDLALRCGAPIESASDSLAYTYDGYMPFEDRHADAGATQPSHPTEPENNTRPIVRFQRLGDLPATSEASHLIKGVLTAGQPAVLFGRSLAAKSFAALHMACCIATGGNWFGRKVLAGCTLYVPFEGAATFPGRMHAIADQLDADDRGLFADRCSLLPDPLPLTQKTADKAVAEIIANAKALAQETGVPCRLIVLDTMFASMPGMSLNEDATATHVVDLARQISDATGAVTLFVHHPGHSNQQRMFGSSASIGGFNSIIRIDSPGANYDKGIGISPGEPRDIILDKYKDGESDVPIGRFNLRVVELGRASGGAMITSCVVNPLETEEGNRRPAARQKKKWPTGQAGRALERLQRLYDQGKDFTVSGKDIGIPDADPQELWCVVRKSDWKQECRNARLTDKPDDDDDRKEAKREGTAFQRAAERLDQTYHAIGMHGDYVWLTEVNTQRTRVSPKPPPVSTKSTETTNVESVDHVDSDESVCPQSPHGPHTSIGGVDRGDTHVARTEGVSEAQTTSTSGKRIEAEAADQGREVNDDV